MAAGNSGNAGHAEKKDGQRRPSRSRSAEQPGGQAERARSDRADRADQAKPSKGLSAVKAMRAAAGQLEELLGRTPDAVSAVHRTDDGWQADVEVLELARVPETTSVMASYRVTLDEDGELQSYEQVRRYSRGQIDRRA
jgi:hypothetical protein